MEIFKVVIVLIFLVIWAFKVFDFMKGNAFHYKHKMSILFFLNLFYFFFLVVYFLGKGNFNLNRYSEMYLILGFLLLIFFFIQELFFYQKSLSIFFIPIVFYITCLGFFFLGEETKILTFNLLVNDSFNYVMEIVFLLGTVLFFYGLILSILYRQLFLVHKFKKKQSLMDKLPSIDVLEKLINFNLIAGCGFIFIKIVFIIYFFARELNFQTNLFDFLSSFGVIFIFCFFSMIVFFRLNSWLHSGANLKWIYFGNGLLIIYFLTLY